MTIASWREHQARAVAATTEDSAHDAAIKADLERISANEQKLLSEVKAMRSEMSRMQVKAVSEAAPPALPQPLYIPPPAPMWNPSGPMFASQAVVPQPSYIQGVIPPLMTNVNAGFDSARTEPKVVAAADDAGGDPRPERLCFGCNQPGHFRRNCPNAPKNGPRRFGGQNSNAKPLRGRKYHAKFVEEPIESKSYLQVEVDGKSHAALMDSGCDITVVPFEFAEGKEITKTRRRLYGVGGNPVPISGSILLKIKLGDLDLEFRALVSKRVTEIMLGLDWLQQQKVHWHFADGTVTVQGRQFLLTSRDHVESCRRLIATRDSRIPPRSEANVITRFNVHGGFDGQIFVGLGHGTYGNQGRIAGGRSCFTAALRKLACPCS